KYGPASAAATPGEFDGFNTTGDVISVNLPLATVGAAAQTIFANNPTGFFVDLPVASFGADPGDSLGSLLDLPRAQLAASARTMQTLLGAPGAIFITLPIATIDTQASEFHGAQPLEIDLPLATMSLNVEAI